MLIEMKTATITVKRQVVLPAAISEIEGFNQGQRVAMLMYADRVEIRPLKAVEKKIDWEAERKKTREAVKLFVDKHHLRSKRIRELTRKDKDELIKEYLSRTQLD